MIRFMQGNLLEAPAQAMVNTVNTVGVMGKGIALMFKEAFPENFHAYQAAVRRGEVQVGKMFVTENRGFDGPKWLINFPTKRHWRNPSRLEWIVEGLKDLRHVIEEKRIDSIAVPPLGCGNGGLNWNEVRPAIERELEQLADVDIWIYEPTRQYQNVSKRAGVTKLTPSRVLVAEMVRRYWVLGIECTYLEVHKLCWFLERSISELRLADPLKLQFVANKYGPYSDRLRHLLNDLDGSYLHCAKRLSDAGPSDTIWFDDDRRAFVDLFLKQEQARPLRAILDRTAQRIDGFESPLGMELLSTVDWLVQREHCEPTVQAIRDGIRRWPAGADAGERKNRLFDDRLLRLALDRLAPSERAPESSRRLPA